MPSSTSLRTQSRGGCYVSPAIELLGYADKRLSSFTSFRTFLALGTGLIYIIPSFITFRTILARVTGLSDIHYAVPHLFPDFSGARNWIEIYIIPSFITFRTTGGVLCRTRKSFAHITVPLASAGRSTGFSRFWDYVHSLPLNSWITELYQFHLSYPANSALATKKPAKASGTTG